jgi:hypothetical protein
MAEAASDALASTLAQAWETHVPLLDSQELVHISVDLCKDTEIKITAKDTCHVGKPSVQSLQHVAALWPDVLPVWRLIGWRT